MSHDNSANERIPKPSFKTCDETSLKLTWDSNGMQQVLQASGIVDHVELRVQYKEVHEDWGVAKEYTIPSNTKGDVQVELLLKEADLVDLKPGTPYYVRFILFDRKNGTFEVGPATVFDTKPVDCTPKRKKCVIS
jgi:hypothetical protein